MGVTYTESTLEGIAKTAYTQDEIYDAEQRETAFFKEISKTSDVRYSAENGGTIKFAVQGYGAHGQKMMNELEALPAARPSQVVQGTSNIKEYAGVIQLSKREMELAKGDSVAFAEAKEFEMESLIQQAGKYFNRQAANGDGSGLMTLVNGAQAADTTIEVDDATVFQIGQVLDIYDAATGLIKQADAVVVVDIDMLSATNSIQVDTAVTCDDNAFIYLAGVHDNAATDGKEMLGIPLAADDGTLSATFQGITRTGAGEVPNYRGVTLNAASAPISEELVAQLATRALRMAGVDYVNMNDVYWLFSPEQWRAYASLATPLIRFMPSDNADLNKHFAPSECMGKRVVVDTDLNRTSVYLIKRDALELAEVRKLDWETDLGGTSLKWLSGTTQGVMLLYALRQLIYRKPRHIARLSTLATVSI